MLTRITRWLAYYTHSDGRGKAIKIFPPFEVSIRKKSPV